MNKEEIKKVAVIFHNAYEGLASSFGYETREDTKEFNPESSNGKLMIAVIGEILPSLIAKSNEEAYERGRQDVITETGGAIGSELKNRWEREAVEGLKDWYARGVEVPDLIGGYTVKEKFLSMLEIDIDFYLKERRNKNDTNNKNME